MSTSGTLILSPSPERSSTFPMANFILALERASGTAQVRRLRYGHPNKLELKEWGDSTAPVPGCLTDTRAFVALVLRDISFKNSSITSERFLVSTCINSKKNPNPYSLHGFGAHLESTDHSAMWVLYSIQTRVFNRGPVAANKYPLYL